MTDAAAIDAAVIDGKVVIVPDVPVQTECDPDPALVACYPFEGDGQDASGNGLHLSMHDVSFAAGKVGTAMQHGAASGADVAEDARFDVDELTIEAWIFPTQMPQGGQRAGVIDNNAQWGIFVHENGRLQCNMIGGPSNQINAKIAPNVWTHVACTYDGSSTRIYVRGKREWTGNGGGMLGTNGSTGVSIAADNPPGAGSRFIGLIDEVRIWNVARGDDDMCHAAGCPDDNDDDNDRAPGPSAELSR